LNIEIPFELAISTFLFLAILLICLNLIIESFALSILFQLSPLSSETKIPPDLNPANNVSLYTSILLNI
jgi:hypothetical protein